MHQREYSAVTGRTGRKTAAAGETHRRTRSVRRGNGRKTPRTDRRGYRGTARIATRSSMNVEAGGASSSALAGPHPKKLKGEPKGGSGFMYRMTKRRCVRALHVRARAGRVSRQPRPKRRGGGDAAAPMPGGGMLSGALATGNTKASRSHDAGGRQSGKHWAVSRSSLQLWETHFVSNVLGKEDDGGEEGHTKRSENNARCERQESRAAATVAQGVSLRDIGVGVKEFLLKSIFGAALFISIITSTGLRAGAETMVISDLPRDATADVLLRDNRKGLDSRSARMEWKELMERCDATAM